ncbi:hypothetical protein ATO8_03851 [Roseivivax marinus]|uniref:Tip attachment protein J domain-containing protein n=1 Tax=Roseivivax marinus TaxID=1379903 RepID=W4HMQ9_9RHOB|nr:phage tail protein [Roseivivax marinus]ETW13994.1 hypothetical protein ATO8_03851 [Roseivivax marinus]
MAFSAHEPEGLRGPQFDGAWVDELGCPAVDKGSNQPNVFLDPKSSESFLPRHSDGRRDELIQHQYLRALHGYWSNPNRHPRLHGFVRGYLVPEVGDARRALQPLMLAYGFDAIERDGQVVFRMRTGESDAALSEPDLAVSEDLEARLIETRGPEAEQAGRVRLRFFEADWDHETVAEESVLPDEQTHAVSETDVALSLTRAEGRQIAERWLAEARLARDSERFALPPSRHLALSASPWPGSVAIYNSPVDGDYALNALFAARAVIGRLETPLFAAPSGRIDRGAPVQVRLFSGALSSITDAAFLSGGNLLAVGEGTPGGWELFQARDATMAGPRRWRLSHRLRGRFGTDGVMPDVWPAGSLVVRLDARVRQIDLAAGARRIARHYRIGPALRPYDDPAYVHRVEAFDGIGLRPYAPAHLRVAAEAGGLRAAWVRRTRIDGDDWSLAEVPLGEETEAYRVRVIRDGTILREATVSGPRWDYGAAALSGDLSGGPVTLRVAQLSARFGDGPEARLDLPVG